MWQSSNPALSNDDAFKEYYGHLEGSGSGSAARSEFCTLQGVANKTALLVAITIGGGAAGYTLVEKIPGLMWISCIAAFVIALGVGFVIYGNPARAKFVAPVYAIVEGVFLGALSGSLDHVLESMGHGVIGGVATQAFVITISIVLAMLALYKAKLIRPTRTFRAVIGTATAGIMICYMISFVMSMFGAQMPFLSLGSAFQGGTSALIGLGLNVLILGVASMWLVIDFKTVEDLVQTKAHKDLEWYGGFALLVTLAWIYYEAVKLVFRIAMLLGAPRLTRAGGNGTGRVSRPIGELSTPPRNPRRFMVNGEAR